MLVLPEAVKDGLKLGSNFETGALPTLTQPGLLGPQYEAFSPAGGPKLKVVAVAIALRSTDARLNSTRLPPADKGVALAPTRGRNHLE